MLTYEYNRAARFPSFSDAAKHAERWVYSQEWFDDAELNIKLDDQMWVIKVSERHFTPRYLKA